MTRDEGGEYSHQIDLTRCSVESRLATKRVIIKDGDIVSIDPYARSDAVKVLPSFGCSVTALARATDR